MEKKTRPLYFITIIILAWRCTDLSFKQIDQRLAREKNSQYYIIKKYVIFFSYYKEQEEHAAVYKNIIEHN